MKRLIVLALALLPALANAGQITLILSDEQETGNAKILHLRKCQLYGDSDDQTVAAMPLHNDL